MKRKMYGKITKVYNAQICNNCGSNALVYRIGISYQAGVLHNGSLACVYCRSWVQGNYMMDTLAVLILIGGYNKLQRSPFYNTYEYFTTEV